MYEITCAPYTRADVLAFCVVDFTFQHGPKECLLNTVEACAIYAWPELVSLMMRAKWSAGYSTFLVS